MTVLSPGVRQFGFADSVGGTVFCDDADLIDDFATGLRIYLIFYRIYFGYRIFNRHTVPFEALILMQDTFLDNMALRRLGDLVIDDTVAFVGSVIFIYRIAEYKPHRVVNRVEITLAVDHRIFVLAYRDTFYAFRSRINSQVQTVDAVRVVYGLEYILILLGLADCMLQGLIAPKERQLGLADCRIQFEQVGLQNHENQLFFVRTAAFRRNDMRVRAGLGQNRIAAYFIVQLICPCVRQLGIYNRIRSALRQRCVEMHIYLHDTVATVNRVQVADDGLVLVIILALVTDSCPIGAGI